jgi:hypothetical protein
MMEQKYPADAPLLGSPSQHLQNQNVYDEKPKKQPMDKKTWIIALLWAITLVCWLGPKWRVTVTVELPDTWTTEAPRPFDWKSVSFDVMIWVR